MINRKGGQNQRLAQLLGWFTKDKQHPIKLNIDKDDKSDFNKSKYKFLLDAPFEISDQCCAVMKKAPAHKYTKETGRKPITGQMAAESKMRKQKWLDNGCNAFNAKEPISNPMAFWTEDDVLQYIFETNLRICSIYGNVIKIDNCKYCTSGCERSGCELCAFGVTLEPKPGRFILLKETHPKMYALLDVIKNNGVTFREAIEWVNEHGNFNIQL